MAKKAILIALLFSAILCLVLSLNSVNFNREKSKLTLEGAELIKDAELRSAIINYYTAESAGEWGETYNYRPDEFRRLVSFDIYQSSMRDGMAGWELLKVEIIDVKRRGKNAAIQIRFSERFDSETAESHFDSRVSRGINSRLEETVWKTIGGGWKCIDAGQRGHLPMNAALIHN